MKKKQFHVKPPEEIYYDIGVSSLGLVIVAVSYFGLCFVKIGYDRVSLLKKLQDYLPTATLIEGNIKAKKALADVIQLIENPSHKLDSILDDRGTVLQKRVWKAVRDIPAGQTVSYSEIALRIKRPTAIRAVASACTVNPLCIVTPCHRVIRKDGTPCGVSWGKERLLKEQNN